MKVFKHLENESSKPFSMMKIVWLSGLFAISAAFLFYNAFRHPFPLAFAGMYALMAEQIADGGFSLPMQVPYYGPGGVPFAYPPLAFYVMAVFLKAGVSMITYTRFIPPIFSLLALFPLYLLVKDLTESHIAAGLAILYAAASPSLYAPHTWSGGIVRGLAFFFMLCGFYFFNRTLREGKIILSVFTGIFLGLTGLTHLFYVLAFALWLVCWSVIYIKRVEWKLLAITPITAAIIAAPWLYIVISRYGLDVLLNTLKSHGNNVSLNLLNQPLQLFTWMSIKVSVLSSLPLSFVLIILGLIYLIYNRELGIPFTAFVSLLALSGEAAHFTVLLGAMLFGTSSLVVTKWFKSAHWATVIAAVFFGVAIVQFANYGFVEMLKMPPALHQSGFELKQYVQKNIPQNSRYLFIAGQSEAEWFPYLLQREPMVSKWGSEWLGTYYQQQNLQIRVSSCTFSQSVQCLKDLNLDILPSDILITRKAEKILRDELEYYPACKKLASVGRYIIWQAQCLDSDP